MNVYEQIRLKNCEGYKVKPPQLCIDSKGELKTVAGHIPVIPQLASKNVVVISHEHYQNMLYYMQFLEALHSCA